MRKKVTFRLEQDVINIIDSLAHKTNATKTEIIERALYEYALHDKQDKNRLLKYAGSWNEVQATKVLDDIYSSRMNKE